MGGGGGRGWLWWIHGFFLSNPEFTVRPIQVCELHYATALLQDVDELNSDTIVHG